MTVDLPARLLADRLTWALAVACAIGIEAAVARYPGMPPGPGLAIGGILLLWQWHRLRGRPRRLLAGPHGVQVESGGPIGPVLATGPRARVLGSSVVLHWPYDGRGAGRAGTLWLTAADVPLDTLRAVRVAINAGRAAVVR